VSIERGRQLPQLEGDLDLRLLNLLSGSSLSRLSLFRTRNRPYVTASIASSCYGRRAEVRALQKEGEAGYAKLNQYTRYATVALAAAQATGYTYLSDKRARSSSTAASSSSS